MIAERTLEVMRQRIYMEVSDRELEYLDALVSTGLYGASRAEVLRHLMRRGFADAITSGILEAIPLSADKNQLGLFA